MPRASESPAFEMEGRSWYPTIPPDAIPPRSPDNRTSFQEIRLLFRATTSPGVYVPCSQNALDIGVEPFVLRTRLDPVLVSLFGAGHRLPLYTYDYTAHCWRVADYRTASARLRAGVPIPRDLFPPGWDLGTTQEPLLYNPSGIRIRAAGGGGRATPHGSYETRIAREFARIRGESVNR